MEVSGNISATKWPTQAFPEPCSLAHRAHPKAAVSGWSKALKGWPLFAFLIINVQGSFYCSQGGEAHLLTFCKLFSKGVEHLSPCLRGPSVCRAVSLSNWVDKGNEQGTCGAQEMALCDLWSPPATWWSSLCGVVGGALAKLRPQDVSALWLEEGHE